MAALSIRATPGNLAGPVIIEGIGYSGSEFAMTKTSPKAYTISSAGVSISVLKSEEAAKEIEEEVKAFLPGADQPQN
jgi:hypothetical protein